tara:strand:+ start:229 stop:1425 length:1197 start_codon:yes stop_codon:yes gene_type:complete
MNQYDIAVVGGGIVGLSSAYKLQLKYPKKRIIVIEKEDQLATHQTGRNSGVIHSGLYYKPGSLRAINCISGRDQLVKFAIKHRLSHDICGKIVLATNKDESLRLDALKINGEKNGLTGLEILNRDQIKDIEPYAEGPSALYVPQSGIISYVEVANKIAELIININPKSKIQNSCKVYDVKDNILLTSKGNIKVKNSVFCGGLFSDRLAIKDSLELDSRIVGFRGEYYHLNETSKHKVQNLIYPVPNPDFPFLGLHFTRMIDGGVECGPNAVFTFKREGYNKSSFDLKDTFEALSFSGTWRLFINHWKFGMDEYRRSFSKRLFLKKLQCMIPSLKIEDLSGQRSGVRAMSLGSNGEVIDDFEVIKSKNNLHVINAPSPAATACFSIADHIVLEYDKGFN